MSARHVCDGECWAHLIRYGQDADHAGCDPFAARAAADREAAAAGAFTFGHER